MPDGDSKRASPTRRLTDLLSRIRDAQREALAQKPPITDKSSQIEFIQGRTAIYALTVTDALLEKFIENNLTSKAAKKHGGAGIYSAPTLWDMAETVVVSHPAGPEVKLLGKLSLADGRRITIQKQTNIDSAVNAKKIWDWQWGLIEPLLVSNPNWVFEDAYQHLLRGGLPTPPEFGADE